MVFEKLFEDPLIKSMCSEQHFDKGDIILKQGEITAGIYYIQRGRCQLYSTIPGEKKPIILNERGPSEFFGEISFIDQSPIVNTVKALTNMHIIMLPRELLDGLTLLNPQKALDLLEPIVKLTCKRIRRCINYLYEEKLLLPYLSNPSKLKKSLPTRIRNIAQEPQLAITNLQQLPLFNLNHRECIEKLASYFDFIRVKKNQILYLQDEKSADVYYVISGALQTFIECHKNQSKLSVVGPSGIVGLIDFFCRENRTTSAMVRENTILFKISLNNIKQLNIHEPLLLGLTH